MRGLSWEVRAAGLGMVGVSLPVTTEVFTPLHHVDEPLGAAGISIHVTALGPCKLAFCALSMCHEQQFTLTKHTHKAVSYGEGA